MPSYTALMARYIHPGTIHSRHSSPPVSADIISRAACAPAVQCGVSAKTDRNIPKEEDSHSSGAQPLVGSLFSVCQCDLYVQCAAIRLECGLVE